MNKTYGLLPRHVAVLLVAAACIAAAYPSSAADLRAVGPRSLVITYHTSPANRIAFRKELEESARQWQRWKENGVLQSYRVLFNRYIDSANWDAMAIVTLTADAGMQGWKKIEQEAPAGLSAQALSLTTSIETVPGDLMRQSGAGQTPSNSVLLVIPYETVVSLDEYLAYLDNYVLPQTDGWMEEGILARYAVYISRYPAGRPWQSLLVLEYKNDEALGARDAAVAKVRSRLKENPKWKAISESKKSVRIEKQPVLADPLASG